MANERELSLKITGDSSKAEKAVANLEAALKKAERELQNAKESTGKVDDAVDKLGGKSTKAGDLLKRFGDIAGTEASGRLGGLGTAADKAGVDLEKVGAGSLVAGAAVVGLGAVLAKGVGEFQKQTEEVRKFKDAVGTSWDASSRLVAISDDLGISAEAVGGAMKKLTVNMGNTPGLLEEYGISAVKAKDGSTDMVGTLANVADAFNATTDATQRNTMAQKLFGKSWDELAPLLQQGGRGIRDAAAGVKDYQIVSAESAADSRQLSMAMDDMQDAVMGLEIAMAKGLIPMLTAGAKGAAGFLDKVNEVGSALSKAANKDSFWWGTGEQHKVQQMNEEMKRSPTFIEEVAKAMGITQVETLGTTSKMLSLKLVQEEAAEAAKRLAMAQRDSAEASKETARALKEQEAVVKSMRDAVEGTVDAQLSYDRSVTALNDSTDALTQRQLVLTNAIDVYGDSSKEAWAATHDYQTAVQDAEAAAVTNAKAVQALAEQQANAAGTALTAEEKTALYRDALAKARDAATDPALKEGLDGMVERLDKNAASAGEAERKLNAAREAFESLAEAAAKGITVALVGPAAGMITTTADSAERTLTPQRTGSVTINAYGADARDLGQLVNQQLINQRMERGG